MSYGKQTGRAWSASHMRLLMRREGGVRKPRTAVNFPEIFAMPQAILVGQILS
jgi:hypothetical protein